MGAFDSIPNITLPDDSNTEAAAAFRKKWKWDAHELVILRGSYTAADQEAVENAASAMKQMRRGKPQLETRGGSARRVLLERMIVDWTFARNGQKVLVTKESIGELPPNYRTPILEQCDEIASGLSEEEQEDFLASANGHSEESSTKKQGKLYHLPS
jgi:hypothetical protein